MEAKKTPTPYDAPAVVTRIEGNATAWVKIAGSDTETPVKLTIDAKAGDTVQVRVGGGSAWITGNSTAPPTDDRTARRAAQTAKEAHVEAAKAVEQTAENTRAIGRQAQSIQSNYQAITRIDTTAVTGVIVQYAKSDSPTVPPTRGWSDASPTWESGKYIWQRTVTTIDGEQIISNVACIQGAQGEAGPAGKDGTNGVNGKDGTNGTNGKDGKDGASSYVHIKYSAVANPSDSQMTETPSEYIGICTDNNLADPTTASSYKWSKWAGKDGTNGIQGPAGKDGTSTYVHFAYANSADGTTDFSVTPFTGAKYVGVRTDTVQSDSTTPSDYEWSELKGDKGEDGTSVTILGHYDTYAELVAAHPSGSSGDSYMVGSDLYVWNGSAWENVGQIQGPQGPAGPQGPQGPAGKDGTNGTAGKDGKDGTSSYVHIKYSSVANPSDSQMTETPSDYIGICTDSNVADPVTASSYTWSKWKGQDGTNGIPGTNGKDGTSTYVHFAYANSSDGTSGFSTTPFAGAKYVGIRTDTTLADSTTPSDYEWSELKGDKGDTGDTGRGIQSITAEYYLSTSNTTQTGGEWMTSAPAYTEGRYYWTRSKIVWDDSTTSYTTPVLDTAITNANSAAYQALRRAGNAEDVANATKQYFWEDDAGVHIASEPEATTATRNMLLNSLGMLFRRGANNLLAMFTGTNPSVNIYDGQGNAESNVLAKFAADGVQIGKEDAGHTNIDSNGMRVYGGDGSELLANIGYGETNADGQTETAPYYDMGIRSGDIGSYSTVEGMHNKATGVASHASGIYSEAGNRSFAHGEALKAGDDQTAFGVCNAVGNWLFAVGNGGPAYIDGPDGYELDEPNCERSNALELSTDGVLTVSGGYGGLVATEDVTVSITYTAGNIGTRGASESLGTTVKANHTYIGAYIVDNRNTSAFNATVQGNGPNNTAHLCAYRATGNAVSNASVTVRKVWLKTGGA